MEIYHQYNHVVSIFRHEGMDERHERSYDKHLLQRHLSLQHLEFDIKVVML